MRFAVAFVALVLVTSCRSDTADPDAQQLARINKEIALLTEQVTALTRRVDTLDSRASRDDMASPTTSATIELTVAIAAGDRFEIDGKQVTRDAVAERLRAHAAHGNSAALTIAAGADSSHARVTELIDLARQSGIARFALTTPTSDPAGKPTPTP